jgi:TM2 domain
MSYCLWCLSFVGICGVQRIYLGQTALGILMLFTFGFCGVGQLLDLFLLPDAVDQANNSDVEIVTNYERLRAKQKPSPPQQLVPSHERAAAATTDKDTDLAELLENARNAVGRTDKL